MHNQPIYAFQLDTLRAALKDWKHEQIEVYPHKAELIETVVLAMINFMESEHVINHKMLVGSSIAPSAYQRG